MRFLLRSAASRPRRLGRLSNNGSPLRCQRYDYPRETNCWNREASYTGVPNWVRVRWENIKCTRPAPFHTALTACLAVYRVWNRGFAGRDGGVEGMGLCAL